MSTDKLSVHLLAGDQAWRFGLLDDAIAEYKKALELDPQCWHAAFQLLWIDAAFRPLEAHEIAVLERPDLTETGRRLVEELRQMETWLAADPTRRLSGTPHSWDRSAVDALTPSNPKEFERLGDKARLAGQHGVAYHNFYRRYMDQFPGIDFDEPAKFVATSLYAARHLERVSQGLR